MADAMFFDDDVQGAASYGRVLVDEDKQEHSINTWFHTDQESNQQQQSTPEEQIDFANKIKSLSVHDNKSRTRKKKKKKIGPYNNKGARSQTLASLELLSNYGKVLKNTIYQKNGSHGCSTSNSPRTENIRSQKLSLEEILKVAGEKYIHISNQKLDGLSMFIHPYSSEISVLSAEETGDVELVQHLLAAAECVSTGQFNFASSLISRCHWIASDTGNAAQRIVFHFAEALTQKIETQTGRISLEKIQDRATYQKNLELDFHISFLSCHKQLPFSQAFQFAAVQAIVENIKSSNNIHLIDLHIRSGIQWTVLMQALSERDDNPTLKISALETTNKQHLLDTGKRLHNFAQSMNIPFSFQIISPSDSFKKEPDETVAVYSPLILRTMISRPDTLVSLLNSIRKLRPSVFVVIEVEANHNSPSFPTRFIESLFYYSALFDCLEDCMERDSIDRRTIEGVYLGEGIRNMVGSEGDKIRCTRNVKLEVWREFFGKNGMIEVKLSESSLCQADMVLKKFPDKTNSSCTLIKNGKGVVFAWKGTPIHSLTTWKFM